MTMAPATESVMGSLPREKAGVGSAVNDTTRQMGGALGVAVIGSVVSSVYAGHIGDVAGRFGLTGGDLDRGPRLARRRARGRQRARRRGRRVRRRGQGRLRRRPQQRAAAELGGHPRRGVRRLALPAGPGPRPAGPRRRRRRRRPTRRPSPSPSAGADRWPPGRATAPARPTPVAAKRGRPRRADADEAILDRDARAARRRRRGRAVDGRPGPAGRRRQGDDLPPLGLQGGARPRRPADGEHADPGARRRAPSAAT